MEEPSQFRITQHSVTKRWRVERKAPGYFISDEAGFAEREEYPWRPVKYEGCEGYYFKWWAYWDMLNHIADDLKHVEIRNGKWEAKP